MMRKQHETYTLAAGPFQATIFRAGGNEPAGSGQFAVDLYFAGNGALHPRYVCSAEEVVALQNLANAANGLVNALLRGATFEAFCVQNNLDPREPTLS